MYRFAARMLIAAPLATLASPALGQGGAFVLPEPNPVSLIALGLAGLIVGRRLAVKKSGD